MIAAQTVLWVSVGLRNMFGLLRTCSKIRSTWRDSRSCPGVMAKATYDEGSTDRILASLIKTAPNTPRVAPTAGDGTAADLAAMALSTALLLADQKHAHRPRSPQAEWSPRVARGHAGKPGKLITTFQPTARALPPLRSPQLAPRPKPTTVVYAALRQQISDRAIRHCDPRFNSWADVDIPPLSPRRARTAVSNDLVEPGVQVAGFYAESIRKSPRSPTRK